MFEENVWMHIGAGSFHRAHQAFYLHRLRTQFDNTWHIALGNIRNDVLPSLDSLAAQNGEYTLETVTPDGKFSYELITSIKTILPWDKDLCALVSQGSNPATKIIGFTVTEGGYYLDNQHNLDPRLPDIQADLKGDVKTLYGTLRRILKARKTANGKPVTLLNCDNLRHNGERFRAAFLAFLKLADETELLKWVEQNTTSPCSMVDRITPRPTQEVRDRVLKATGRHDKAAVMGESFVQWIIEDHFASNRPPLEKVGVEFVDSVLQYEEAKLRILNATHAFVAWAGTLTGLTTIDESTNHPFIRKMAYDYITEDVIPALLLSPLDLSSYRDVVLDRFCNPYIRDTNERVAADGLSKIPGFVTPTMITEYEKGHTPTATIMSLAVYYIFLQHWHDNSLPYVYLDGALNAEERHAMMEAEDSLRRFAKDESLFGSVTKEDSFEQVLRECVKILKDWIAEESKP